MDYQWQGLVAGVEVIRVVRNRISPSQLHMGSVVVRMTWVSDDMCSGDSTHGRKVHSVGGPWPFDGLCTSAISWMRQKL